MTRYLNFLPVALALLLLAIAAGCEKRPTGLDPNPNTPEGTTTPLAQLVAYRNHALRVMVRDYGSPTADSIVTGATAFPGPTSMPLLLLFDGTQANTYEMYRRDDGGQFIRTTDFEIPSHFKYVDAGYETFFSTDPAPGDFQPSTYLARGLLNGVATHESPLSNESRMPVTDLPPIIYNGDLNPVDSLFTLSWVGVPGAVGYWLHAYVKPIPSGQRLQSALPAPLSYETASDLLIGYYAGNNPGGSVQYKLGSPGLLTLKSRPPLLGTDYCVRVTGVDADGEVIAQTPGDLDSVAMTPDLAYLAPTLSPDKSKLFFSLSGVKVARRPRVAGPAGVSAGNDVIVGPPQRHIADVRFPAVAPLH